MKDLFEEIWSNIRRNKLRTALTGFAVAWGIFMLIFLLGAGNGLIHALESNNNDYMTNTMNVWGGRTSRIMWKRPAQYSPKRASPQATERNISSSRSAE